MVTISGTAFTLVTGALPQRTAKKCTKKTMALTRGNGHRYVMVILGHEDAWDLEAMSSARLKTRPETRWVYLPLATFWATLLITVSGLKEYSWFLIGIGGLGTLQNIYVAAAAAKPEELNIRLWPHPVRSTVTGYQMDQSAKRDLRIL
jgi:hypothetical protein